MSKLTLRLASIAFLFIAPFAVAQNNRSAVSVGGLDTNPCTVPSPCRSFSAAMSVTNDGGEIVALDSAGYGPFNVDRAVTVSGAPGVHAAISVPLNAGISVATPSEAVTIRNLVLLGTGGIYGIDVSSASETRIIGCTVRGFATAGIHVTNGNVVIDRTAAIDNIGTTGMSIGSDNDTTAQVRASLTNCLIDGNYNGLVVRSFTRATLSNSVITNNAYGASAISVLGTQLILAELIIDNSTIANNIQGLYTFGSGGNNAGEIWIANNVVAYNTTGALLAGHSFVTSFGDNRFVGNGTDGGPFPTATFE